jgi:hypothetical protein
MTTQPEYLFIRKHICYITAELGTLYRADRTPTDLKIVSYRLKFFKRRRGAQVTSLTLVTNTRMPLMAMRRPCLLQNWAVGLPHDNSFLPLTCARWASAVLPPDSPRRNFRWCRERASGRHGWEDQAVEQQILDVTAAVTMYQGFNCRGIWRSRC